MRRLIGPVLWMVVGGFVVLMAQHIHIVRDGAPVPVAPPATNQRQIAAGALIVPVVGVTAAALRSSFADPRGDGRIHGAIDIPAPLGTPVLAAASGTVEKIFESEKGGHTVYLRAPDGGTVYYYAHLDRYADGLREGMFVTQGTTIGYVGASGDAAAAGPHLHFEVKRMAPGEPWYRGDPVDPYPLLAGNRSGG